MTDLGLFFAGADQARAILLIAEGLRLAAALTDHAVVRP